MKSGFIRFVCRILVVCIAALPFQAQAVLIGTDEAAAARVQVKHFIDRSEVASQLQALGISPQLAQERVAALTDAEAAALADRIDRLPAGAFGGQGLGILIVVIFLIWRFFYSDQAKAEAATAKPAAKPAAKPDAKK
jgi:uncharacterized protein DUF6627